MIYKVYDVILRKSFECADDTYLLDAPEEQGFHYEYSDRAGASDSSLAYVVSGGDNSDGSFLDENEKKQGFVF